MRRGGKWSWKWFIANSVAWFLFFRAIIEIGSYFSVTIFSTLRSLGVYGFLGVALVSIALAPLTFLLVHALNSAIRFKLDGLARQEQKINRHCRLVFDRKRFMEHQFRLISEANEFIFATGSRSRDREYLNSIEKRLRDVANLTYTRILFGEIKRPELRTHCTSLISDTSMSTRAKVCEITDLNRHTESFVIINEREALVVIPSFNAISNFDTCILLTGPLYRQMKGVVESYARTATEWKPEDR